MSATAASQARSGAAVEILERHPLVRLIDSLPKEQLATENGIDPAIVCAVACSAPKDFIKTACALPTP